MSSMTSTRHCLCQVRTKTNLKNACSMLGQVRPMTADTRSLTTSSVSTKRSAGGPALPAAPPAQAQKALVKLRQRPKESYGLLTKHVLDADHLTEMKNSHFQLGHTAFTYLQVSCQRAVNPLHLREMNKDFDDILGWATVSSG